jgi:hypothetical protein
MKKVMIVLIAGAILAPTLLLADQLIKVDRPTNAPSFLGYVPDRFIAVMKPEVGPLRVQLSSRATAHIGDTDFDQLADRFVVSEIVEQFPGASRTALSGAIELARYHKIW